ncbi:uncharacterized protein LOC129614208 [Condylostylus longicornis]|uniref:uncharacterized protein LOC129614208 n=1 Tax=Condylostylus longicornis TaxID=2530218 RepID=UPI00244DD5FC|nr:uncharacterized protein LOC129614208 [Condylostylus longicornis]XP_055384633.1 uncharacterized protein LOC129614208 [Condylostylus longicornis]
MANRIWNSGNKLPKYTFKHVGSLSYTEDDILIYTLYISAPLKKTDSNKLKEYFSTFGEVESVNIFIRKKCSYSGNNRTFSFAFVCFKEAESASKALRRKAHFFCNRNIIVRSADSWKQPFQKKLNKSEDEVIDCENTSYSILNLNDDCLFIIFKYLPFNEQIKMSTLCTRLEYIFELIYKTSKTLDIDLEESLTLMDFRQGLQKIGHHIENITFSSGLSMRNFTRFIDFVSKFCPNLCKLRLDSLHFKYTEIFHKISTKLHTICHLELKNCSINDEMMNLLSKITTIEYLDLTDNYEITGLYLHKFKNIKTLILNSCANIQSSFFIKMCSKTTNLRELNIRLCDRLNTCAFQALVENLNELETLTICTCYQTNELEKITELKSLKHLTINQSSNKTDPLFSKLANEKKDQLETLKVTNFSHSDIKGSAITELVKLKQLDLPYAVCTDKFIQDLLKLKDLRILNIPGVIVSKDCILKYITKAVNIEFIDLSRREGYGDEFLKNVIEILKKQNRSQPLTLRVEEDPSTDVKEEKTFLRENRNILRIDPNKTDYVMEMFDSNFHFLSDDEDDDDDYNTDFEDNLFDYDDLDSDNLFDDDEYDSEDYNQVMDELAEYDLVVNILF